MKIYCTPDYNTCIVQHLCTATADGRREIDRSENAEAMAKYKSNYLNNQELYRKRQEINEHIFATIKRKWGYNLTNLRGIEKVNREIARIMTVYNIKRVLNIPGIEKPMTLLKTWTPKYKGPNRFYSKPIHLSRYNAPEFFTLKIAAQ